MITVTYELPKKESIVMRYKVVVEGIDHFQFLNEEFGHCEMTLLCNVVYVVVSKHFSRENANKMVSRLARQGIIAHIM